MTCYDTCKNFIIRTHNNDINYALKLSNNNELNV